MCVNEKMTAIADGIRGLMGVSETMTLDTMNALLGSANSKSDDQARIIGQIKTALEGKAGGGSAPLPVLTNPGSAGDLAQGKQLIGADGQVVEGTVMVEVDGLGENYSHVYAEEGFISPYYYPQYDVLVRKGALVCVNVPAADYGDLTPEEAPKGKKFTSAAGFCVTGTAEPSSGMVVKTGTTTSRTIDTGLSDIEQFFMYKESQTGTGLIRLHYTKEATSRMYASAWSTQNYGTKTITNGTGGVTVNGGSITISATQATQGALTSNVTYKWIAVGRE